jgi:hypothetical protein
MKIYHSVYLGEITRWFRMARYPGRVARRAFGLTLLLVSFAGCGDDEPSNEEVCNAACSQSVGSCAPVATLRSNCSTACQVAYSTVPACAAQYRSALACVGGSPFVRCASDSVTVSTTVAQCSDELGSYLGCAAQNIGPACLDAPLGDGDCAAQGPLPHSRVCVGAPEGCRMLEGTSRSGGVSTFCCP